MQKSLTGFLVLVVVCLIALAPPASRADATSAGLINLTGGITGYDGSGINIGQLEGGVPNSNHVVLAGQIAFTSNLVVGTAGTLTAHATQVAGVMVSTADGIAPGSQVYSLGQNPATNDMDLINNAIYLADVKGVRVINQSFGGTYPVIGTNLWERGLDYVVSSRQVTFVQAAGNAGDDGFDTIEEPAAAYNIIAVGAVNHAGTAVAGFSSRGYLGDGRSKPDIVAPGSSIIMPTHPIGGSGDAVATNSGTSFAAPHVAGVVARLLEVADGTANPLDADPRVIKAVLLNSATKLAGWSQTKFGTDVTQPLDPHQGAGLLNAGRAYDQLIAGEREPSRIGTFVTTNLAPAVAWDLSTVGLSLTNVYYLEEQAFGEARLTLTWYRNVGGSGTNYSVLSLANLDLYLWSSPDNAFTNLTLVERSISGVDNVEHLYLTSLETNYYAFGVYYAGNLIGSDGGTIYALAWEFTVVPEPSTLLLVVLGLSVMHRLPRRRARGG
jgi:hypothetical protein